MIRFVPGYRQGRGRDPIYIKGSVPHDPSVSPHKTLWQPPGRGGCVLSGGAGTIAVCWAPMARANPRLLISLTGYLAPTSGSVQVAAYPLPDVRAEELYRLSAGTTAPLSGDDSPGVFGLCSALVECVPQADRAARPFAQPAVPAWNPYCRGSNPEQSFGRRTGSVWRTA